MRVVLDTNVLISGLFWRGTPYRIFSAWRDGRFVLTLTSEILAEYVDVAQRLADGFPGVDIFPLLELVAVTAEMHEPVTLPGPVCSDPADDKFVACALTTGGLLVSGDKHLLAAKGYQGVEVLTPADFARTHLASQ